MLSYRQCGAWQVCIGNGTCKQIYVLQTEQTVVSKISQPPSQENYQEKICLALILSCSSKTYPWLRRQPSTSSTCPSLLREYLDHEFQKLKKFDDIYSDFKWLEGKAMKKANGKTVMDVTQLLEGVIQPVKRGGKSAQTWRSWWTARQLRGDLLFGRMWL